MDLKQIKVASIKIQKYSTQLIGNETYRPDMNVQLINRVLYKKKATQNGKRSKETTTSIKSISNHNNTKSISTIFFVSHSKK